MKLFDDMPPEAKGKTCNTCKHRERWQIGGKIFQYCSIRKSNLTNNGKLKIKCKTPACPAYKTITHDNKL